jgi:hypothetical protein
VAVAFSNKDKERKRVQLFMVQFHERAVHDNLSHTESDQISHMIGRCWIVMSSCISLLLSLSNAYLRLNQWADLLEFHGMFLHIMILQ